MKKLCKKCGVEKTLSEMVKNKTCINGRSNTCKACKGLARLKNKKTITCKHCYREFSTARPMMVYCSRECYKLHQCILYTKHRSDPIVKKNIKAYNKEYGKNNRQRKANVNKAWIRDNPDKYKTHYTNANTKSREELRDAYIRSLLSRQGVRNPPISLIELIRIQIKGKRLFKQLQ